MSGKRYSDEFKIEAVKQVTEWNYPVSQVASRLGITTKSLYDWIKRYGDEQAQYFFDCSQADKLFAGTASGLPLLEKAQNTLELSRIGGLWKALSGNLPGWQLSFGMGGRLTVESVWSAIRRLLRSSENQRLFHVSSAENSKHPWVQ